MTKVLITGGGSFCGRHLSRYLRDQGVDVSTMGSRLSTQKQHHHITDITSTEAIASVLATVRPDFVFHLAGVASASQAATYYKVNAAYSAALLQALEQSGLAEDCPTMLVGTSAEYGVITPDQVPIHELTDALPYHHYGISKLAQTRMGTASSSTGRPLVMVRPFNIVGPGMPPHLSVQNFASQVVQIMMQRQAPVIEVGNLGSSRDFIDIDDAIAIYWQLIQNPRAYGEVINICTGQGIVMSDLLDTLIEVAAVEVSVQVDPQRFKAMDIPVHYGCTRKLAGLIGATPKLHLQRSLKRILDSMMSSSVA